MTIDNAGLSRPGSDKWRMQRALLDLLRVHEGDGTLPTSARFLFYELVGLGVVSKERRDPKPGCKTTRRPDQPVSDALLHLRQAGLVPWDWIVDETRDLTSWRTAATVSDYVLDSVALSLIDRWDGAPAPLIVCESRSLAGVLRDTTYRYACPITATNGQARGHLVTEIAPALHPNQRVLYLGDWDYSGSKIEANTRGVLFDHTGVDRPWERVALTTEQVEALGLNVQSKLDSRFSPPQAFDAVETEELGQGVIVDMLRARLDELMPEPIDGVLVRQQRQRERVAELLRGLN